MSGTITPASLKSLLSQIDPAQPGAPARAGQPVANEKAAGAPQRTANADARVNLPKDAVRLDPNAPRGTYVNLTV